MSYCRFSCDNWKSDVYCYADCGGYYQTHVAGSRLIGDCPTEDYALLMSGNEADREEFTKQHRDQMAWLESAEREDVGLEHDGASFQDKTPEDCLARLLMLQEAGYHVPEHALEGMREEVKTGGEFKEGGTG